MRHEGRTALVTGAGSGIGRGIASRLASEGARVACLDVNPTGAAETVALIAAAGGQALALTADVRRKDEVSGALELAVGELGRLDYLVNNAGVVTMTGFADLTE